MNRSHLCLANCGNTIHSSPTRSTPCAKHVLSLLECLWFKAASSDTSPRIMVIASLASTHTHICASSISPIPHITAKKSYRARTNSIPSLKLLSKSINNLRMTLLLAGPRIFGTTQTRQQSSAHATSQKHLLWLLGRSVESMKRKRQF